MDLLEDYKVVDDVDSGQDVQIQPTSALSNGGPFDFQFETPPDNSWWAPDQTRLTGRIDLMKLEDGTPKKVDMRNKDVAAGVSNIPISALFESVSVSVNGQRTNTSASHGYPYIAYFNYCLNFDEAAKLTNLWSSLWHRDTEGHMDTLEVSENVDENNQGLIARKFWLTHDLSFETYLFCDLFTIDKLWPPNTTINVHIERKSDTFALMCPKNQDYYFEFTDLKLIIRRVSLSPSIYKNFISSFKDKRTAKFKMDRTNFKNYLIAQGTTSITIPGIVRGIKPQQLYVAFVDSKAFNGDITKNPFNFQHFKLTQIGLVVNGVSVPSYPLTMNPGKDINRMYRHFMDNAGIQNGPYTNGITQNMFGNGYFIVPFDLTPGKDNGQSLLRPTKATIDLELRFKYSLKHPIECLVYTQHQDVLHLNNRGEIKFATEM